MGAIERECPRGGPFSRFLCCDGQVWRGPSTEGKAAGGGRALTPVDGDLGPLLGGKGESGSGVEMLGVGCWSSPVGLCAALSNAVLVRP